MAKRGAFLQRIRAASLWLALLAFAFKALLPAGYMLDKAQGQRLAIVFCNPVGATSEAYLDLETGEIVHDKGDQRRDDPKQAHCPFAVAAAPALDAPHTDIPAPAGVAFAWAPAARAPETGALEIAGPPLPARGPPILA
ncbi:MAG: hypothetical protein JNJ73_15545 [Hyphomonadaceae bacterium]|nr:hypothetical protein [Hyphomonadaceae bacterium]